MTPNPAPVGDAWAIDLVIRRDEVPAEVELRDLADGTHGVIHLPEQTSVTTRARLVFDGGKPQILAAGSLRDGRPVTLQVQARRTH